MRRPHLPFRHRRGAPYCPPLRLERLEDRLALSHGPLPGAYESLAGSHFESYLNDHVSNHADGAYFARMSPLAGIDFGRVFGPSMSFGGGISAGLTPFSLGDFQANDRPIPSAPSHAIDRGTELFVVVVVVDENYGTVVQPADLRAGLAVHTELSPALSVAPPIDSRIARPSEAMHTAIAEGEHHSNQSVTVGLGIAETSMRASQTASATVQEFRAPVFAIPTLPQQATVSMNAPGDTGPSRSQPGLAFVPRPGLDTLQPPNSRLPQSKPNLGRSPSSAALPSGDASHPNSESAAATMSTSGPVAGEIATVASDRSRAALLASLPVNMESVDQALLSMMREVEGLGGELVMWLDDSSVPPWAVAAALSGACGVGGRYIWRMRDRRSAQEESEEESSSWLFTRLQSPAGQP